MSRPALDYRSKAECAARYFDIEVDDALVTAEKIYGCSPVQGGHALAFSQRLDRAKKKKSRNRNLLKAHVQSDNRAD